MEYKLDYPSFQADAYSTSSAYLPHDSAYPPRTNGDKPPSEHSFLRDLARDKNPTSTLSLSEHNGYSLQRELMSREQLHRDPNMIYDDSFLYERNVDRSIGFNNMSSHGTLRNGLDLSAHGSNLPQHTRHARRLYFGGESSSL